jgi:hypothetical protein
MMLFLKRIGFVVLVFIGMSMLVSWGSLWALRQSSFYKPSFLVNSLSEKSFDYIVLGASTGLTTLNTKVIDSMLHTNGVNLSMDDTALSSQYLMLQHFLAQGKTTKVCVLAPSVKDYDVRTNELSGNDYRFLPYVNTTYVYDYYKQFKGVDAKVLAYSKWFPMLGVSYYNVELFYPSLVALMQPEKRNRFDATGNYVYPESKKASKMINDLMSVTLDFKNPYLNKIKALCKANDIELICYISPMEGKNVIVSSAGFSVINHSNLLNDSKYFFDSEHVDAKGRKVSSVQFAFNFEALRK